MKRLSAAAGLPMREIGDDAMAVLQTHNWPGNVRQLRNIVERLLILASSVVIIDLGFVLLEPQLEWYVGLSGVLHGALAAGAIGWWQHESRPLALALTLVLIGKLAWEQWHGALPLSGDMPVVVDAHLYGAIGGALAGACLYLHNRAPFPHRPPTASR